jgi:hypothetical protein
MVSVGVFCARRHVSTSRGVGRGQIVAAAARTPRSFLFRELLHPQSLHCRFYCVYQTHSSERQQRAKERERKRASESGITVPLNKRAIFVVCVVWSNRWWWLTAGSDWPNISGWWAFAWNHSVALALAVTGTDYPCRNMWARTHSHCPHLSLAWARAINFSEFHIHEHCPWVTTTSESECNNHERICARKYVSDDNQEHCQRAWPLAATSEFYTSIGDQREWEGEILANLPYEW